MQNEKQDPEKKPIGGLAFKMGENQNLTCEANSTASIFGAQRLAVPIACYPAEALSAYLKWLTQNFFVRRARCWLCQRLCGDQFFNRDASLEIDRLTVENEKLRAQGAERSV